MQRANTILANARVLVPAGQCDISRLILLNLKLASVVGMVEFITQSTAGMMNVRKHDSEISWSQHEIGSETVLGDESLNCLSTFQKAPRILLPSSIVCGRMPVPENGTATSFYNGNAEEQLASCEGEVTIKRVQRRMRIDLNVSIWCSKVRRYNHFDFYIFIAASVNEIQNLPARLFQKFMQINTLNGITSQLSATRGAQNIYFTFMLNQRPPCEAFEGPSGQKQSYFSVRNGCYRYLDYLQLVKHDRFQSILNVHILVCTAHGLSANDTLHVLSRGGWKILTFEHIHNNVTRTVERSPKEEKLVRTARGATKPNCCFGEVRRSGDYADVVCRAHEMTSTKVWRRCAEGKILKRGRDNQKHRCAAGLVKCEVSQSLLLVYARTESMLSLWSDQLVNAKGVVGVRKSHLRKPREELACDSYCAGYSLPHELPLMTAFDKVRTLLRAALGMQCTGEQRHSVSSPVTLRSLARRRPAKGSTKLFNSVEHSRNKPVLGGLKMQRSMSKVRSTSTKKCNVRADDKALLRPSYCVRYRSCFCTLDCTCPFGARLADHRDVALSVSNPAKGADRRKSSTGYSGTGYSHLQDRAPFRAAPTRSNFADDDECFYDFSEHTNVPSIVLIPFSSSTSPAECGERDACFGSKAAVSMLGGANANNNSCSDWKGLNSCGLDGMTYAEDIGKTKACSERLINRSESGSPVFNGRAKNRFRSPKIVRGTAKRRRTLDASQRGVSFDVDSPTKAEKRPLEIHAPTATKENYSDDISKTAASRNRDVCAGMRRSGLNLANEAASAHTVIKEYSFGNDKNCSFARNEILITSTSNLNTAESGGQITGENKGNALLARDRQKTEHCSASDVFISKPLDTRRCISHTIGRDRSKHQYANAGRGMQSLSVVTSGSRSAAGGNDRINGEIEVMGNSLVGPEMHDSLGTLSQPSPDSQSGLVCASDKHASIERHRSPVAAGVARMVCNNYFDHKRKSSGEDGNAIGPKLPRQDVTKSGVGIVVVEESAITPMTPATDCRPHSGVTSTCADQCATSMRLRSAGSRLPRADRSPPLKVMKIPVHHVDEIVPNGKGETVKNERGIRTRRGDTSERTEAQHAEKTLPAVDKRSLRQLPSRQLRSSNEQSKRLTIAAKAIVRKFATPKRTRIPVLPSGNVGTDSPAETKLSRRLRSRVIIEPGQCRIGSVTQARQKRKKDSLSQDYDDQGFWEFYRKYRNTFDAKNMVLHQRYIKLLQSKEAVFPCSKLSSVICAMSAVPNDSECVDVPDDGLMPFTKRLTKSRKNKPALPEVSDEQCAYCERFFGQDKKVLKEHLARHGKRYATLSAPRTPKKKKANFAGKSVARRKPKTSSSESVADSFISSTEDNALESPSHSPSKSADRLISPFPKPVHLSMGHRKHTARKSFSITSTLPKDILIAALECKLRAQSVLPTGNAQNATSVTPVVIDRIVNSMPSDSPVPPRSEVESPAVKQSCVPSARKTLIGLPSTCNHQHCNGVLPSKSS